MKIEIMGNDMNKLIERLQKEVSQFQKTLKKESDDIVETFKAVSREKSLAGKRKQIEALVEKKFEAFEPAITKLLDEVKSQAKKAGFDLGAIEKKVTKATTSAKSHINDAADKAKTIVTKGAKSKPRPAGAKTGTRKKTTKKSS